MPIDKRALAALQLVLIFPAAVFMAALLVRYLQPMLYEPARAAQLIITWYSGRIWTLWILLISLPLAALIIGCIALLKDWIADLKPQAATAQPSARVRLLPATLLIVAVTLAAGAILVIVAVHMLMN